MMSSRSAPMRKYALALTLTKLRYLLMRYSAANSSPLLAQSTNCSSTISWYTGTTGLRATTTPLASAPNVRLCQTIPDASRMLASTLFVGAPDHPVVSDDRLPRWALLVAAAASYSYYTNAALRSEEHTSELQSPMYLVCRLLLEKKKKKTKYIVRF